MDQTLLLISTLVFVGFMLIPLSRKLGAPILLLVLICGMLAGEDGPGQIQFDDFEVAYSLGSLALAIILFAGGLETSISKLKGVLTTSALLATLGVIITTAIVGIPASYILNIPLEHGLLLGAVVGSTDAGATFLLIQQNKIRLPEKVKNTLIFESGINDPMAIFLTIAFTTMINQGTTLSFSSVQSFLPMFLLQMGLGAFFGILGGIAISRLLDEIKLSIGLYPPLALAGALIIYSGTAYLGGSGFLAVFLFGLVMKHQLKHPLERILNFSEGLQWLSQIALFLMLGLLVTPSALTITLIPALLLALILMFIARPVAVLFCIFPARFSVPETTYISWVGLRGAVPIFLAIFPVITPGPIQVEFFNIVFVIVVASLVLQGWTVASSARWLGLSKQKTENK